MGKILTRYWKNDKNRMGARMNIMAIVLGVLCVGYGIFTAIMREKLPERFGKLEAMKKKFGDKRGNAIHIVAYSVVPLLAGIVFAVCGFFGIGL
jgi:hypothetical protein